MGKSDFTTENTDYEHTDYEHTDYTINKPCNQCNNLSNQW